MFLLIFLIIIGAITLFYVFSTSTYDYWRKLGILHLKPTPFFGNMLPILLMRQAMHETYDQLYKFIDKLPYGDFFEMRTPVLVIKDPILVQRILVTDFKHFMDRGTSFNNRNMNRKLNPLNENFAFLDGLKWKAMRQKLSPMFTSRKLKGMQNQIFHCTSQLIDHMEINMTDTGKEINIKSILTWFMVDVTGTCILGIECNAIQMKNEFQKFATEIMKPRLSLLFKYFLYVINKKLLSVFQLTDFPSEPTKFFQKVVYDAMLYRRRNNLNRGDLLQYLMELQNKAENPKFAVDYQKGSLSKDDWFDEVNVVANAFVFFVGGFETSSSTMSYFLYEVALNEKIQEKLRNEVWQVYHKNGNKIDFDCLHELTYMDSVISETLRKYPILPVVSRECSEDYVIAETGLKIKRGDAVHIPAWSLHHDWRYYPNPESFDPERFNDGKKQPGPPGTYLPFGDGPRSCIGKLFADMVMKSVLSKMLILYHFTPCSKTEMPLTYEKSTLLAVPRHGIWLNIMKRDQPYTL